MEKYIVCQEIYKSEKKVKSESKKNGLPGVKNKVGAVAVIKA